MPSLINLPFQAKIERFFKRTSIVLLSICLLLAIATLILSFWTPTQNNLNTFVNSLAANIFNSQLAGFYMLGVTSFLNIALFLLGIIAIIRISKGLLYAWQVFGAILLFLHVVAVIILASHKGFIAKAMKILVIQEYGMPTGNTFETDIVVEFERLQLQNNCCGATGQNDWYKSNYTYYTAKIPRSCCRQIGISDLFCKSIYMYKRETEPKGLRADVGCADVIKNGFNLILVFGVALCCFHALTLSFIAGYYQLLMYGIHQQLVSDLPTVIYSYIFGEPPYLLSYTTYNKKGNMKRDMYLKKLEPCVVRRISQLQKFE